VIRLTKDSKLEKKRGKEIGNEVLDGCHLYRDPTAVRGHVTITSTLKLIRLRLNVISDMCTRVVTLPPSKSWYRVLALDVTPIPSLLSFLPHS
jgi:hypothetical protein